MKKKEVFVVVNPALVVLYSVCCVALLYVRYLYGAYKQPPRFPKEEFSVKPPLQQEGMKNLGEEVTHSGEFCNS
jgi:hypothetical protein